MRRSLPTTAFAVVALLALAPRAGAEVYPGAAADRTFDAPSAWSIAPASPTACAFTNVLDVPVPGFCTFQGRQDATGGVADSGDLIAVYDETVTASTADAVRVANGTTTFASPAFTVPAATGAATFSVDRRADVAGLIANGGQARSGVVLADDTAGTQRDLLPLADVPVTTAFTTLTATVPRASLAAGHVYRIVVTTTLGSAATVTTNVSASGSISFDNAALSLPTAADPTGTIPGDPGSAGGGSGGSGPGGSGGSGGNGSGGTGGPNGLAVGASAGSSGPGGSVLVPGQGYTGAQLAVLLKTPSGRCTIWGTRGNDRLLGTKGRDIICGLGGNDVITGAAGNDLIYGDAANNSKLAVGNDTIDAGAGDDAAFGGRGDDRISGGAGKDRLFGGDGADSVSGGAGKDVIHGNAGNDRLDGGAGPDDLAGETGDDVLSGGAGNDLLAGGKGRDHDSGGSGNDVLNARDGSGHDVLAGGSGKDRARTDRGDRVSGVEKR